MYQIYSLLHFSHVYPAFEESLIKTIRNGNFLEISKKITPKAFTKCENNALLISMLVSPSYSTRLKSITESQRMTLTKIKISLVCPLYYLLKASVIC